MSLVWHGGKQARLVVGGLPVSCESKSRQGPCHNLEQEIEPLLPSTCWFQEHVDSSLILIVDLPSSQLNGKKRIYTKPKH